MNLSVIPLIDLANYAIMTVLELDDQKAEEHADER